MEEVYSELLSSPRVVSVIENVSAHIMQSPLLPSPVKLEQ